MSLAQSGLSALGKLLVLIGVMAAFVAGMAGVVYMSLQGEEIKVPEIVGKNFLDSERELEALGLKIKKRADRPSPDAPNTVLEQLPKPGETVKTGQMILVVVSTPGGDPAELPTSLKKDIESDDSERIEEMISDEKPKRPRANTNSAKKKADTTRDVIANTATDAADSKDGDKKDTDTAKPADKTDKPATTATPAVKKPADNDKPPAAKP